MPPKIDPGQLWLGRTLLELLDIGCARAPNPQSLNQWRDHRWQGGASQTLRQTVEEIALGLRSLGLQRGDRIPLVMHSDINFCRVDFGCLLAGLVDVPIDLTQTVENILFILNQTQAQVMVISNLDLLQQLTPYLWEAPTLRQIIVADVPEDWRTVCQTLMRAAAPSTGKEAAYDVPTPWECLHVPQFLGQASVELSTPCSVPACIQLMSLADVQAQGQQQWSVQAVETLRADIAPTDLATIIYIAGSTERPLGVMLTHENIAANALTAFSSYPQLQAGPEEVALLFLPLTHIFARVFLYGHLAYGHTVYLSDPNHLFKHLRTVRPTVMITVPRLLEKVYERVLDRGSRLRGLDRQVFTWALNLAQRFDVGRSPQGLYALQLQLADALVFAKWRVGFGDRLKALICGGAALRPELVQVFTAAGIPLLQGYGLTETSGVVCYNRGAANRAGTVGLPIAGVEIALATDHEILIRSPFVMAGYYQNPEHTQAVLEDDGWLHTGDLGKIDADGFLTITGVKKPLFKLSTGKYVSSQLLEATVMESPLVDLAIATGAHQKFCGMLIFPNLAALSAIAHAADLDTNTAHWWQHPVFLAHYQVAIDTANCHLPYWSTVRQFRLVDPQQSLRPTPQNGGYRQDGTLNRIWVLKHYTAEIEALYQQSSVATQVPNALENLNLSLTNPAVCPVHAQSLLHH
ncbi:MAG: AMP-binding protein [Leptolyngbya sp. SIOISBB]|nr:AMP-binding protein [Leptolyngbya sp. SIOISBB]